MKLLFAFRYWRIPSALVACALVLANPSVGLADIYKREGFVFDVPNASLKEVQDLVALVSRLPNAELLPDDFHPMVTRWGVAPCYLARPDSANLLSSALDIFRTRLNFNIVPCKKVGLSPEIMYYFTATPPDEIDRNAILSS